MSQDIGLIQTLITTDPDTIGLTFTKSDTENAALFNGTTVTVNKSRLTGAELRDLIVEAEWNALSEADRQLIRDIFALWNDFSVESGGQIRADILATFPSGTAPLTRANFVAAAQEDVSYATSKGLEFVKDGHVAQARAL